MLYADAQTLVWVSGTSFGRDVVPDVGSTSATSSGRARPLRISTPLHCPCEGKETRLGLRIGASSMMLETMRLRDGTRWRVHARLHNQRFGVQVSQIHMQIRRHYRLD